MCPDGINRSKGEDEQKQGRLPVISLREKVFYSLDAEDSNKKATNNLKPMGVLIILAIGQALLATEPVVRSSQGDLIAKLDIAVA